MPITYQQTSDVEIHTKVRRKHQARLAELKRLGFEAHYFFGETVGALGFSPLGCSGFVGMLVAVFNEVLKVDGNWNVIIYNVATVSREPATYGCPFGLGVKFYTGFTDGTCIISANFETPSFQDDQEKLYKSARPCTISAAWNAHKAWIEKLSAEGKQINELISFAGYLKLVQQEDNYMLKNQNALMRGG